MKVGVTGAAGHLGIAICKALLEKGYEVVAFIHNNDEGLKDLPLTIVRGNVLDLDSLRAFISQCDSIIHAAGAIELSYKFNQNVYDINVTGTQNVIKVMKELNTAKLVFLSSAHVFQQKPHDIPLDETRSFVTENSVFYDQTKRDAHLLVVDAAQKGLDAVIVCPSAVLGPNDYKPSKLGQALIDIYTGKFPALFKGGFDFVDVRDVAEGTLAALEKGGIGETYILGGKYHSIKELSDIVFEIKGIKKQLIALPFTLAYIGVPFVKLAGVMTRTQPIYDKLYVDVLKDGNTMITSAKAKKEIGYTPRTLKETINDTIHWFKDQQKL